MKVGFNVRNDDHQSQIDICIREMHKQTCVECAIKTLCGHTMEEFLVKHTTYLFDIQ